MTHATPRRRPLDSKLLAPALAAALLLSGGSAGAQSQQPVNAKATVAPAAPAPAPAKPAPPPVPTDAECRALGAVEKKRYFGAGEVLEYDLDAMGAEAGKLTVRVLPQKGDSLPIEAVAVTNTFFSKVRRVKATAMTHLKARTLRPTRYTEDALENEVHRLADVTFAPGGKAQLEYKTNGRGGKRALRHGAEALDPVGAVFLLRQLPLKEDMPLCFDAYAIRTMWRVSGKVVGKEKVSLKVGQFEAWHLQGEAVVLGNPRIRREVHLWISADERRLPLASVGILDLGAVRATLGSYSRPDGTAKAEGKDSLKW